MIFIELRNELVNNIPGIRSEDVLLLEGKLMFQQKTKAEAVKKYLQIKFAGTHEVLETQPRKWPHWENTYVSELYLRII
jgi:hypothetical protein